MAKFAVLSKVGYIVKKLFFFEQLQVILLDGCCSEPNCKLAMDCREWCRSRGSLRIIMLEYVKIKMILLYFEKFQTFDPGFATFYE